MTLRDCCLQVRRSKKNGRLNNGVGPDFNLLTCERMTMTYKDIEETRAAFQQEYDGSVFPALIMNADSALDLEGTVDWVKREKEQLLAKLSDSGTVLFRGFPLSSPEDFDAFVAAFDEPGFTYRESLSNAVRVNLTERVFTANEAPPEVGIYLHHEMAQTPLYPSKLYFFCEVAADEGGETPVCRSDVLLDRIAEFDPEFVRTCREKLVKYSLVMPGVDDPKSGQGRGWQSTLGVDSREQAENRLTKLGYSWKWLDDGSLRTTTPALPAIRKADNGREAFFNQLIAAFLGWADISHTGVHKIAFGDGSPMPDSTMRKICELAEELTVNLPWQAGDVAMVDNFQVMHGRRSFVGRRRVLASLVA